MISSIHIDRDGLEYAPFDVKGSAAYISCLAMRWTSCSMK